MMAWTDRHDRFFLRLITQKTWLFTEMITAKAILKGDRQYLLDFDQSEHPIAIQLGGNNPEELAESASIAEDYGYDEINLNVGCPSNKVRLGEFGASLMTTPKLVANCMKKMQQVTNLPVSIKHRIGIDEYDSYAYVKAFVSQLADQGCCYFYVHARNALLKGLSPKQNREIPPLKYDYVHRLKSDFPHLTIVLNGGIISTEDAQQQLHYVDGVMIGRAAYHNPFMLVDVDRQLFGDLTPAPTRQVVLERLLPYVEQQLSQGVKLYHIVRHILGLFHGMPGARAWRQYLTTHAVRRDAGPEVILQAARLVAGEQASWNVAGGT